MRMEDGLYSLFDATEETHWWFVARRRIVLSLLKDIIPPGSRPRILDVGCGTGATLRELEGLGGVVGVDISEAALAYCMGRGCTNVLLVEEDSLPFADGKFDVVVSLDVLEHVEDDLRALLEYARVLKKGGVLLLTAPAYPWLWSAHDDFNRHRRRYTLGAFKRLLGGSGLSIGRVTYFCTYLFPLVVAVRLAVKAVTGFLNWRREGLDLKIPGQGVNRVCMAIFSKEAAWLSRRNFAFGSSLLAVCRKVGR